MLVVAVALHEGAAAAVGLGTAEEATVQVEVRGIEEDSGEEAEDIRHTEGSSK